MGKQVNFFADDIDFGTLLTFAGDQGYRAVPNRTLVPDEPVPMTQPRDYWLQGEDGRTQFYVLPPGLTESEAFYRRLTPDAVRLHLIAWTSAVIEVCPCQRLNESLGRGRIYVDFDRRDPRYEAVNKGYERLARYLRKWERFPGLPFSIGPHTLEQGRRRKLRLWNLSGSPGGQVTDQHLPYPDEAK